MFYKKANFNLSTESSQYVIELYKDKFNTQFTHDLDNKISNTFIFTKAGIEIRDYLKSKNLLTKNIKFQTFISNNNRWFKGNPHIDITPGTNPKIIKTRFNILILGNPQDKMFWWSNFYSINQLELMDFTDLTGICYKSYGIPGKCIEDRWSYIGNSSFCDSNILTSSAFVKTNCLHTVNVSPGPRLVLSIPLDVDIENIV